MPFDQRGVAQRPAKSGVLAELFPPGLARCLNSLVRPMVRAFCSGPKGRSCRRPFASGGAGCPWGDLGSAVTPGEVARCRCPRPAVRGMRLVSRSERETPRCQGDHDRSPWVEGRGTSTILPEIGQDRQCSARLCMLAAGVASAGVGAPLFQREPSGMAGHPVAGVGALRSPHPNRVIKCSRFRLQGVGWAVQADMACAAVQAAAFSAWRIEAWRREQ